MVVLGSVWGQKIWKNKIDENCPLHLLNMSNKKIIFINFVFSIFWPQTVLIPSNNINHILLIFMKNKQYDSSEPPLGHKQVQASYRNQKQLWNSWPFWELFKSYWVMKFQKRKQELPESAQSMSELKIQKNKKNKKDCSKELCLIKYWRQSLKSNKIQEQ